MNGGGAEREGDTESEAGSRLRAISPEPDAGLEPTDCEIVRTLNRLSHPGAPETFLKYHQLASSGSLSLFPTNTVPKYVSILASVTLYHYQPVYLCAKRQMARLFTAAEDWKSPAYPCSK